MRLAPAIFFLNIILAYFLLTSTGHGTPQSGITPEQIQFVLQQNVEPYQQFACSHKKSSIGLFEWDISCTTHAGLKVFAVHLVVSFYPKTLHGVNSYEVLYWLTDWSNPRQPVSDSSTIWMHNSHQENYARAIEVFQGVENDLASLRIMIKM